MNQRRQPVMGVIGGAGVAAGARLAARLEARVTEMGAYQDVHHPEVVLWQATSAPSRSLFLEGRGPDFRPAYAAIGRHLKACGADVFCMACNAAHRHAAQIAQSAGLPLIHLLDELFDAVRTRHPQAKRIGVLSSTGSRDCRIFDEPARGLELRYADDDVQRQITAGICGVKSAKRWLPESHPERPQAQFRGACRHLVRNGAQALVLGCTDIGVDFPWDSVDGIPVVDGLDALADALLRYWLRHGEFDAGHPLAGFAEAVKRQA